MALDLRLVFGASLMLVTEPGIAVPPPPPPAGYNASWVSIDALDTFVGHWTGEEVQHVITGGGKILDFGRRRYLKVDRPEGRDLILMEEGSNDSPPYAEFTNVITFDPQAGSYKMFMPGYRLFTGSSQTSALVSINREANGHLSWSVARDDGGTIRTSVWLDGGKLHERQELVKPDGSVIVKADAVMVRGGQ